MNKMLVGGCFAPLLDVAGLDRYEQLSEACDNQQVKDYMRQLITMLRVFWETSESTETPVTHWSGAAMRSLEDAEIQRIWDVVPWESDLDAMSAVFDTISDVTDKELRNAAFHLVWYGRELTADREPLTSDKLPQ